jgi:hypothetical protein
MSPGTRRTIGAAVLAVGCSVVAAGVLVIVLGTVGGGTGRDETVGSGIALLMAGMLVVLAGRYVHHGFDDGGGPAGGGEGSVRK